jgi:1-acyl-sn-glycerol-3-phosphate acyltransferase
MFYRIRWWLAGAFARVYTLVMFKKVAVTGPTTADGPRLVVANHFGGLVDAIVVVRALGGLPHIVAKSTLFKTIPIRWILRVLGVVPVYRRSDHSDVSKNASSFHEVTKVLAKGRTVLIFPEGTVTDSQELQKVRTGAARMALNAIDAGVENLEIVPLGITYEDKVASRSRVLVEVGDRITDEEISDLAGNDDVTDANRRAVALLHHDIRNGRRAVEPAARPHQRRRAVALDVARAEAEVVALQRGD